MGHREPVLACATAAAQFAESEDKGGPYPGDAAFFSFSLYSDPAFKHPVGSAIYTCFYYFDKNAFCDTTYQLTHGVVVGGAALVFNATTFKVAAIQGTGSYAGDLGQILETASGSGNTQGERLQFELGKA